MDVQTVARTIQLILAPVVMVTASGILISALLPRYDALSNRLRAMVRERLELLRAAGPNFESAVKNLDVFTQERLHQIDYQVPDLLRRHKLLRNAVLTIYWAIVLFIASMFVIAVAALRNSMEVATSALALFLVGTGILIIALLISAREMRISHHVIQFEALRLLQSPTIHPPVAISL